MHEAYFGGSGVWRIVSQETHPFQVSMKRMALVINTVIELKTSYLAVVMLKEEKQSKMVDRQAKSCSLAARGRKEVKAQKETAESSCWNLSTLKNANELARCHCPPFTDETDKDKRTESGMEGWKRRTTPVKEEWETRQELEW